MKIFFFIFILLFFSSAFAVPNLVKIKSNVIYEKLPIRLFDIIEKSVDLDIDNEVIFTKLNNSIEEFTSKEFVKKVSKNSQLKYILPPKIRLIKRSSVINKDTVKHYIEDKIKNICSSCKAEIVYLQLNETTKGEIENWEIEHFSHFKGGSFTRSLVIYKTNGFIERSLVTAKVNIKQSVIVSKSNIQIKELLSPDLVYEEEKIFEHLDRDYPTLSQVLNKRTKIFLNSGKIIEFSHLEKEFLIQKGQFVPVEIVNNHFTISLLAKALTSGNAGDIVSFLNMESNKKINAMISKNGKAVITELNLK